MKLYEFLTKYKWTKYYLARDKNNMPVGYNSSVACKWCVGGVIFYLYGNDLKKVDDILKKIRINIPTKFFGIISDWNDNSTYEEVYSLLKKLDI